MESRRKRTRKYEPVLRIGVIGCGHIGTVHSYGLKQLAKAGLIDARITATYDPDITRAEAMASHSDAVAYERVESLLDVVDVVWICTWTAGHLAAVEQAVARGLAVFCEKPLAPNLADCQRITELLSGVPHQVGLVLRHAPVFAICADIVQSGEYGRVLSTVFRDDQYFPIQGMYASTWRANRADAGGGTLIEHSIHDVDLLNWILGVPSSVSARTAERFGYEGIEDTAIAHFAYPDHSQAVMVSIWHQVLSRGSSRRLEIFCEDAYCWTEDDYLGPVHIQTSDGTSQRIGELPEWASLLDVPELYEKSVVQYAEPAKAFLDGLVAPGGPRTGHPNVQHAMVAHQIVEQAYVSAAANGAPQAVGVP